MPPPVVTHPPAVYLEYSRVGSIRLGSSWKLPAGQTVLANFFLAHSAPDPARSLRTQARIAPDRTVRRRSHWKQRRKGGGYPEQDWL